LSSRDDLFQPTLQDHPSIARDSLARPWRLGSQLWVAFFGGPLAIAGIAYLNARRLGVPRRRANVILAAGAGASIVYLAALGVWIVPALASGVDSGERTLLRYSGRAFALLLYVVLRLLQRQADALYRFHRDGNEDEIYESLWGPGALACLLGGGAAAAAGWLAE